MDSANGTNAAAGKRKAEDINPPAMMGQPSYAPQYAAAAASPQKGGGAKKKSKLSDSAKVQARLEANRKAARESRRRKKILVEELQRSVRVLLLDSVCFVLVCWNWL